MQSFSDFVSKNFTFGHSVKTINKSGDVTIENGVEPAGKVMKGWTKFNFPAADFGKAEVQICANGKDKDTKAKIEFANMIKDADFTLSASAEPNVTLEASYSQSNFGAKAEFSTDCDASRTVKTSVNASSNGIKATMDADICAAGGGLTDYNFKVDYKQKDLCANIKTSKGRDVLSAWIAQNVCSGFYWGAQVEHTLSKGSTVATAGAAWKVNNATTVRKLIDSNGCVKASVEHKLSNPSVKVNSACEYNILGANPCKAQKFGFGLTFGDF